MSLDSGPETAVVRVGIFGLGNVGGAFARLAREAEAPLRASGVILRLGGALVRTASRPRAAASLVSVVTEDPDRIFADRPDVIVEALGGIEPARALITRALDRGIAVVTANKSLIAAHGDELLTLASRRGTTLRYEATCIAGVPFLGTFERRPLAARVHRITAILNGTSNAILSALDNGASYEDALADAQRRGLAEPDPSADVTGVDAAQKLAILVRLFAQVRLDPTVVPTTPLHVLDAGDLVASADLGARIKPIAHASWTRDSVTAFVAPALVPETHPLAHVSDVTNGIVLDGVGGRRCYIGPGAGPDVTAATLLDDVVEAVRERAVRQPSTPATRDAHAVHHPVTGWFVRVERLTANATADALNGFGIASERLASRAERTYVVTLPASVDRMREASAALRALSDRDVLAIPSLSVSEAAC